MEVKNLAGLDPGINNVISTHFPYYWVPFRKIKNEEGPSKKRVIFLGNDMSGFVNALGNKPEIAEKYVEKVNQCLNYIRRECVGCDFFYKPHPSDPNEHFFLNLEGFNLINEKGNAEIFFWKNRGNIEAVFAVNSLGLLSAYGFGLNAYAFSEFFRPIFGKELFESIDDCYAGLPERFFIRDFNQRLLPHDISGGADTVLENYLRGLLAKNQGDIWFVVSATEFIVILISLASFIKSLEPSRKIRLIISRHHRWDLINEEEIKPYFDEIIFLPRVFYALRISKLFQAVRVWMRIKQFGLKPEDIIISGSQVEFVENCFISSFKQNHKVGLILKRDFYANYDLSNSVFSKNNNFYFSRASWFFNKILEPLLGLNKTMFLLYSPGCTAIVRYQKPVNQIFNQVVFLDIPRQGKSV